MPDVFRSLAARYGTAALRPAQRFFRRSGRATLAANKRPTRAALRRAQTLGRQIVLAVEQRHQTINTEQFDPAFALPDSNWHADADNDYCAAYRMLRTLAWDEIKYLRFRSQSFPGYSLLHFTHQPGTRATDPVPHDFDARIPNEAPPGLVARWKALVAGLPRKLIYRPPAMLGEVGWWISGVLVNEDTASYQERVTLLHHAGVLDRLPARPRVLEIGGGYGALAAALLSALPGCEYWICDLPESLLFSGLYLSLVNHRSICLASDDVDKVARINLLPNYFFDRLRRPFDLVINTLSMSEMSEHQISRYATGIARLIVDKGVFFEQNQDNRAIGLGYCKPIVGRHFSNSKTIEAPFPVTNGIADIWSNA